MAATFKKVEVDGHVIRATKGEPRPGDWTHMRGRAYPLEIDGAHRGYLHYKPSGWRTSGGWRLASLVPDLDRDGTVTPWRMSVGMPSYDVLRPLREAALDRCLKDLPPAEGVQAWIESALDVRRRNAELEAERATDLARRREERARQHEALSREIAAEDAHIKEAYAELLASPTVSNYQREGLILAARRLNIQFA